MGSREIISGNLQVLKTSIIKSSWQTRWCVLYDSSSGGSRLEYFDSQDSVSRSSAHKKVINLDKISRIDKLQAKQNSFPFDVTIRNSRLSFIAKTAADCENWTQAFTQIMNQDCGGSSNSTSVTTSDGDPLVDNVLYETTDLITKFNVVLSGSESEAAKSQDLVGQSYQLAVGRMGYELFDDSGQRSLQHWPFRCVRRYGATGDHFILVGGSRCQDWSGEFRFQTSNSSAIKDAVDRMTRLHAPNSSSYPASAACPQDASAAGKERSSNSVGLPRRGSASDAVSLPRSPNHSGDGRSVGHPPQSGGSLKSQPVQLIAELDDKLYEFTKVRPELEFRHPRHQGKASAQAAPAQPISAQPATPPPMAAATAGSQSKAPLPLVVSSCAVEPDDRQKSFSLTRGHSADYEKALKKKNKEEKKREEKEKKEQDRREKEQEKERRESEKKKKEQEKKEREESKKKLREQKSKSLKKSGVLTPVSLSAYTEVNTYEEVDIPLPAPADRQPQACENDYSDADFRPQPAVSAAPSRGHTYSEPDQIGAQKPPDSSQSEQLLYSQVTKNRSEAWKEFGRAEDNTHEEDYDRIKMAVQEAVKTKPDGELPPFSGADDDSETYDSLVLQSLNRDRPVRGTSTEENLYGMASAVPVQVPQLQEEGECGYEDAEIVTSAAAAFQRSKGYIPSHDYEEADFGNLGSEDEEDPYSQVS